MHGQTVELWNKATRASPWSSRQQDVLMLSHTANGGLGGVGGGMEEHSKKKHRLEGLVG